MFPHIPHVVFCRYAQKHFIACRCNSAGIAACLISEDYALSEMR